MFEVICGLNYADDTVRKQFTGYERDDETDLDFAQARYFKPTHGRFTSVDQLTASASIRDPQTFNRYSYVLNSPYKFTDPLGLLSVTTGACGQWCSNSDSYTFSNGGALTSGAVETPFAVEFASMALARDVVTALENLQTYGSGVGEFERSVINAALDSMLRTGTQEVKRIAADIVNSNIEISVVDNLGTSGAIFVRDAAGLNSAIAEKGTLSALRAMGFFGIQLGRYTAMTNYQDLEATLAHEGKHVEIAAAVVVSLSTGNKKSFQDELVYANEVRASTTATAYLIKRGGDYSSRGKNLGYVNPDGSLNQGAMKAKGQNAKETFAKVGITSTQGWLRYHGVVW